MHRPESQDETVRSPIEVIAQATASRRAVLAGLAGMGMLSVVGDLAGVWGATPANAQTPLEAAIAEAQSMVGLDLTAGSPNVSSLVTVAPWANTAPAEWCAWWATYIARATGFGKHTSSSEIWNNTSIAHSTTTPHVGDFIYYVNSETTGHTGFVVGVTNGVAQTIEGNAIGNPTKVKAYAEPWSGTAGVRGYSSPNWGSAPPSNNAILGGQTVFTILYVPSVTWQFVFAPGMYIKNAPDGQASTLAAAMGANVYNVPDLNTLNILMWDSGFADQFGHPGQPADAWALLQTLSGGGILYSTAYQKLMAM